MKFHTMYLSKNFFSKTVWLEKLELVWRHPQIVMIQICSNHDLQGKGVAAMGAGSNFYIRIYREKYFKVFLFKTSSLGRL